MNEEVASGLACVWADGRSSRMRTARIRLRADDMLQADAEDGAGAWPKGEVRLSPRLGSTPRMLRLPDGGSIEVQDSPLLDQWFGKPRGVEPVAHWLERRRSAILGAAILVLAGTVAAVWFGVPWAAREVAQRLPPAVERNASDQALTILQAYGMGPSALPPRRTERIASAFQALVANEPRAGDMRVRVVSAPRLGANAFALPDGRIYVTDALVKLAADDEEVLAVLAHEAGHHVHHHGMRNALERSSVFVLAGLLLGDASGSSLTVALPAVLLDSRFSRGHEAEADAYAFDLLRRHGISPRAFARIMRRLDHAAGGPSGGPADFLASHPPTPARIRRAEAAANGR